MHFVPGPQECEVVEGYIEGGYHPTSIGDEFCEGRYSVVHKLGHGGYATVWLVRDHNQNRYAALKILTAGSSPYSQELKIFQYLQEEGPGAYDMCRVIPLFDNFSLEGPNGTHLCLVFEFMGPSLASFMQGETQKIRPDIVRKLAREMALGLEQLHKNGVVYGDLSPGNILIHLTETFNEWTTDEIYEKFGHPEPREMREFVPKDDPDDGPDDESDDEMALTETKPTEDPHAPKNQYMPIDFSTISHELLRPEVRLIDLGEAYLEGSPYDPEQDMFGVNSSYADPETLWWTQRPTRESDIWALACIWYEMRAAEQLFSQDWGGVAVVQNGIIDAVGAMPKPWLDEMRRVDAMEQGIELAEEEEGEEVDAKASNDIKGTERETKSVWGFVFSIWTWVREKCRLPTKLVSVVEEPQVSPTSAVDQEPRSSDEHAATDEEAAPGNDMCDSLSARIHKIGQWKPWCYLTIEERRVKIREVNRHDGVPDEDEDKEGALDPDTGNPPPGPLSEEEAVDFESILSSMLTYKREDRALLEQLIEHPWLNKTYAQTTSEPWLQQFHVGVTLAVWDYEQAISVDWL